MMFANQLTLNLSARDQELIYAALRARQQAFREMSADPDDYDGQGDAARLVASDYCDLADRLIRLGAT